MMACQILISESELQKMLPKNLTNLPLSNLSEGIETSIVYVHGQIIKKWPLQRSKKTSLLKLEVIDASNIAVTFYLTGTYAEICQAVTLGDTIAVSNMTIKVKEGKDQVENTHEIYVDRCRSEAKVWVVSSSQTESASVIETTKKTTRSYGYTPLKNLQVGTTVNVYGVVKFFKAPTRSKGTDFSMMFSLMDQSLETGEKVKCLLFAKNEKSLPQIENVGDIVRIHRLKVTRFRDEIQGQRGAGFSCLVFDGDPQGSLTPRTNSTTFTFNQEDRERIEELRDWTCTDALFSQHIGGESHSGGPVALPGRKTLSQVDINQYFNLQCQVVSTCVIKEGESVLLRVWDGTKVTSPVYEEDLTKGDYHTRLNVSSKLLRRTSGYTVDVFVFDDHFEKGKAIKPEDFIYLHNLHAATHKFSATEENIVPTIEFCLHGGTVYGRRLTRLDPEMEDARLLQLLLNEATEDDSIEMPEESSVIDTAMPGSVPGPVTGPDSHEEHEQVAPPAGDLTEQLTAGPSAGTEMDVMDITTSHIQDTATVLTDHHHIKRTLLKDVITHKVPYKFRIKAKVYEIEPNSDTVDGFLRLLCPKCNFLAQVPGAESLEKSEGQAEYLWSKTSQPFQVMDGVKLYSCPNCSKKQTIGSDKLEHMPYIYMLQFVLFDGTGWIVAGLWKNEAVKFFHGIKPIELLKDSAKYDVVREAMKRLCPSQAVNDGRPYVECCVYSFSTPGGVCYKIFDTKLAGEGQR